MRNSFTKVLSMLLAVTLLFTQTGIPSWEMMKKGCIGKWKPSFRNLNREGII